MGERGSEMKLSEKRRMAIYSAVSDKVMDLRIAIRRINSGLRLTEYEKEKLDAMLSKLGDDAGSAALEAAEETYKR